MRLRRSLNRLLICLRQFLLLVRIKFHFLFAKSKSFFIFISKHSLKILSSLTIASSLSWRLHRFISSLDQWTKVKNKKNGQRGRIDCHFVDYQRLFWTAAWSREALSDRLLPTFAYGLHEVRRSFLFEEKKTHRTFEGRSLMTMTSVPVFPSIDGIFHCHWEGATRVCDQASFGVSFFSNKMPSTHGRNDVGF